MKMLTKKDGRVEIERLAIKTIMTQKDEFKIDDVIMSMRVACGEDITTEEIEDVAYCAIDFCLNTSRIDIFDEYSYMVDPVKQIAYESNTNDDKVSV